MLAFQAFNAFNFTIALGAPLILIAKFLGGGDAIIGVLLSLTPFLVVLQLWATNLANHHGYKRMMLAGWGTRAFTLLLIAPLPFLVGRVSPGWLVAALVFAVFAFNAIRGFTSGSWLPWLTLILPPGRRGQYLGIEQLVLNLSALATLLGCGAFLGKSPEPWRYCVVFASAAVGGWISVFFLRKAPCPMPEFATNAPPRPWGLVLRAYRDIWRKKTFRRTIRFCAIYTLAVAAFSGFLVVHLRENLRCSEGTVLWLSAAGTLGVLLTAVYWGRLSDRVGSRPILRLALTGQMFLMAAWFASAAAGIHLALPVLAMLFLLWGVLGTAYTVSQVRFVLGCCPPEEVTIGMSLYQVIVAQFGGIAPLAWGFILQSMRHSPEADAPGIGSPFGVFFLTAFLLLGASNLLLGRIREAQALPTHQVLVQMIWDWPMRVLTAFSNEKK